MSQFVMKNVTTKIGAKEIVKDISFHVNEGEMLALVGHNGAGKSTLIKTALNIIEKDRGDIMIAGKYHIDQHLLTYKKHIAYLPEEPLLLPELTIMQHFQLYGMSYDIPQKQLEERIATYVKNFDLSGKMDLYPEELSKGMRQKAQAICAFLPTVKVLCIDEPFIGLDIYAQAYMLELMQEKLREGTSIILSTHQLDVLEEIADRYIVLENGRVVEQGAISEFASITRGSPDA